MNNVIETTGFEKVFGKARAFRVVPRWPLSQVQKSRKRIGGQEDEGLTAQF